MRVFKKKIEFLGDDNEIGDILVDTYVYKETNKSTDITIEESHDEHNFSLQSIIHIPSPPSQPSTINTPSPSLQPIDIGYPAPNPSIVFPVSIPLYLVDVI